MKRLRLSGETRTVNSGVVQLLWNCARRDGSNNNMTISSILRLLVLALMPATVALAETTVFVNVNVVPMNAESVVRGQTVVIENRRIAAIGTVDSIPVPKDALVVDGTDRYLMPGLAEMHAHVTGDDGFDRLAALFVANGVTTIRGMLGRPEHLRLREQLLDNSRFGPRLITSGPSLNGRSVSSAEDAAAKVRAQHAAGYDFVKVHPGLDADEFESLGNTANEIGMPFAGHVPVAAGVKRAFDLRMSTIDHLDGYFASLLTPSSHGAGGYGGFFDVMLAAEIDEKSIRAIARETAAAGVWNVPTQVLIEQLIDETPVIELKNRPEMRFVTAGTLRQWGERKLATQGERGFDQAVANRAVELRRRLVFELHEAGAGLLLGSDAPQVFNIPGYSLHRELDNLVASGLSPYEALRTGTTAVAEFLGTNTGVVAVGRDADLVLVDDNPLTDIRNASRVHGVMVRGKWYARRDLDELLEPYIVQQGK